MMSQAILLDTPVLHLQNDCMQHEGPRGALITDDEAHYKAPNDTEYLADITHYTWQHGAPHWTISERATTLMLASIGQRAQSELPSTVAADALLSNDTGLTITDFASFVPDADVCAETTNALHTAMEIKLELEPYTLPRVSPSHAVGEVYSHTVDTLTTIQAAAISEAAARSMPVPAELGASIRTDEGQRHRGLVGPWSIDRDRAAALDKWLADNPALKAATAEHLSTAVNEILSTHGTVPEHQAREVQEYIERQRRRKEQG